MRTRIENVIEPYCLQVSDGVERDWPKEGFRKISQSYLCQLVAQLGGQHMGEGHELLCLIGGIAKHMALVSCAHFFQGLCAESMDTLSNVW